MSSPAYDYPVGSHTQPRQVAGGAAGAGPLAEQEVLGTRGCVFVLQGGRWKERAIGNLKLVLDLRTLDIQIVANSVEDKIVTYLLTSRVRSKGPRAWVLKARATSTSTEEILAIRFGHETDSQAFKDFMEHAYLLDRQMTSSRNQQKPLPAQPEHRNYGASQLNRHASHPRLDRKTSTASFKLATQQQFPSNDFGHRSAAPRGRDLGRHGHQPANIVPLTESNLKSHNRVCPPKRRTVQSWLDQCMALQEGRSPSNMKTVNDASHLDYIANRLQGQVDGT